MTAQDQQSRAELLPCPFCGSEAKMSHSRDGEVCNVRCAGWSVGNCLGAGPNCYTEADAVAGWNRRAPVEQAARALPAGQGPTPEELMALSRECAKMPGGVGMYYYNYARAVLARWGAAPAQAQEDALGADRWRALEGQVDEGRASLIVHNTEAEQWDGRTISEAGDLQDYADAIDAARAAQGGAA